MLQFIQSLVGFQQDKSLHIKIKTSVQSPAKLYDYNVKYTHKSKHVINHSYLFHVSQKSGKSYLDKVNETPLLKEQSDIALMGMIVPTQYSTGQKTFLYYPATYEPSIFDQPLNLTHKQINLNLLRSEKNISTYRVFHKEKVNQDSYQLKQNDIIRIGKKQFKVAIIQSKDFSDRRTAASLRSSNSSNFTLTTDIQKKGACKICLLDEQYDNELISPCNCQGSCSLVHISCLKKWVTSRGSVVKGKNVQSMYYEKLNCEICKKRLPEKISVGDREEYIYQLDNPSKTYMILESIGQSIEQQHDKTIFVVCPKENQPITLGRGQKCDIRIQDKTATKVHSLITMTKGKFYIKDNGSKFGTLIKITKPLDLKENSFIQAGRLLFQFKVN